MKTEVLIALLFSMLHLKIVSGAEEPVQCYVCNSFNQEGCARGNVNSMHLKNCSDFKDGSKYTACRTIEQNIDFKMLKMEPDSRIVRQCAEWDGKRPCYYRGGFGGRVNVCHCKGIGCNSASFPTSVVLTIFLSLLFSLRILL